jgi:cytochrome bd ubiquinol oxidase subunit II
MAFLLACIMVASLVLYVLLGGADYGAGLWDLLSSGGNKEGQKELIANAIQPIWEANHVWLILIIVLMFSGFPLAFGTIMTALYVPILLMLIGIVLRGSSFVFRAYSVLDSRMQRAYGYVFSISSCFTPFFAGVILGSVSDDHVFVSQDVSLNGYVFNWLNPFTISSGVLTLALFAFLAAAYLTVEAPNDELRRLFRRRAGAAAAAASIMAILTFILSIHYAPRLAEGLVQNGLARCSEFAAGITLATACFALYKDRARLSRTMAAAHVGLIAVSWAAAQYPYLVRPERTIFNSAASESVIRDIVYASIAGALVLFPSLGLLFFVFKDKRRERTAVLSVEAPLRGTSSIEIGPQL